MCKQFAYKRPQKISSHSLKSATKQSIFGKAKPIPMKFAVILLALMFVGGTKISSSQQNDFPAIPQTSYSSFNETLCIDTIQKRIVSNYEPWIRKQIDSTDHLRRLRDDLNYTNSQSFLPGQGIRTILIRDFQNKIMSWCF